MKVWGQGEVVNHDDLNANFSATGVLTSLAGFVQSSDGGNASLAFARAFASGAKCIVLPSDAIYDLTTPLTIPDYCSIEGQLSSTGILGVSYNSIGSNLRLGSGATITTGRGASLRRCLISRAGLVMPAINLTDARLLAATFSGTAVTYGGDDSTVEDCLIIGFAQAISSVGFARPKAIRVRMDCVAGIKFEGGFDIGRMTDCQAWPYTTVTISPFGDRALRRSGTAFLFKGTCDWSSAENCFAFGYNVAFQRDGSSNIKWINCHADYTNPNNGSDGGLASFCGFQNINSVTYAQDIGCTAIACTVAIYHSTTAINSVGGDLRVVGGAYGSSGDNIVVNGSAGISVDTASFYAGTSALNISTGNGVQSSIDDIYLGALGTDFTMTTTARPWVGIGNLRRDSPGLTSSRFTNTLDVAPNFDRGAIKIWDRLPYTGGSGGFLDFMTVLPGGDKLVGRIRASLANASAGAEASGFVFSTISGGTVADRFQLTPDGQLSPSANQTYDLGLSTFQWRTVWAQTCTVNFGTYGAVTAPGSPPAGTFVVYMDAADGKLKAKASTGTVTILASP